jgi:hypothetical protein
MDAKGNPLLDFIHLALKKYGPHSDFLGCPQGTNIHFLSIGLSDADAKAIENYFNDLNLSRRVNIHVNPKPRIRESDSMIDPDKLSLIMMSRIPIHIATIDNSTLVPMQNGVNIGDLIADCILGADGEGEIDLVDKITQNIKFGIYDSFIKS